MQHKQGLENDHFDCRQTRKKVRTREERSFDPSIIDFIPMDPWSLLSHKRERKREEEAH